MLPELDHITCSFFFSSTYTKDCSEMPKTVRQPLNECCNMRSEVCQFMNGLIFRLVMLAKEWESEKKQIFEQWSRDGRDGAGKSYARTMLSFE
eukprot:SAG31_NODE_1618_length_7732_cov_28.468361_5_plen_93_part_00